MADHQNRVQTINGIMRDLAGLSIGTPAQKRAALESFYSTHLAAIEIYKEFGDLTSKLQEDVQADATHTWLANTPAEFGGSTVRQHIIDRLDSPVGGG